MSSCPIPIRKHTNKRYSTQESSYKKALSALSWDNISFFHSFFLSFSLCLTLSLSISIFLIYDTLIHSLTLRLWINWRWRRWRRIFTLRQIRSEIELKTFLKQILCWDSGNFVRNKSLSPFLEPRLNLIRSNETDSLSYYFCIFSLFLIRYWTLSHRAYVLRSWENRSNAVHDPFRSESS